MPSLVFGAFDGLHKGHIALLNFAKSQGGELHVALATDEAIQILKRVQPAHSFEERKEALMKTGLVTSILASQPDDNYASIRALKPGQIILGYDQELLRAHLLEWLKEHKLSVQVLTAPAHYPERYKTSLLYDRNKINP
jgi:cytidyltransferase-like protein